MRVKGCHEMLEVTLDAEAKLAGKQQPTMERVPIGGGLGVTGVERGGEKRTLKRERE